MGKERLEEVSTTEISKVENPDGFDESREVAKRGGNIACNVRKEIKANTGKKVISKIIPKHRNYWIIKKRKS